MFMNSTYKTLLLAIVFCLMQAAGILPLQADNAAWMGSIPDNTFVSQLSIPGSHDAGTGHGVNNVYVVVSGNTYAKTQDKTLTEQWNSGIRAFDLRPAVDGSNLRIYHGIISTNLYMNDALSTLCGLLDSHPTETCIVIMRHESEADSNNSNWGTKMKELLSSEPTKSHAVNFDPMAKLGDVRGKLIILSRDTYDTNPIGGYITGWGFSADFNNQKGGKIKGIGTEGPLYIQDYYDVSASGAPATKTSSIQRMLQFSTSENTNPGLWVVNQTSGYSKTKSILSYTLATSDGYRDNAQTQNPVVINYLANNPGATGIILMDFAGEDASGNYQVKGQALTNALIANNSKAGPHADYFRALGDINAGSQYCITTNYSGTKYYLTSDGHLTSDEMSAGIFTFSRVEGATYTYGFNLLNSYFTNPTQTNGSVNFNSGCIRTDASSKRKDWEAQVFFKNSAGKYAIRATNANGSGNWESAAKTYWTVNSGTNGPVAEYSANMNYVWNVEAPSPYINVTFNLYFNAKKVGEVTAVCERGSDAILPEEHIRDFCTYTYNPKTITSSSVRVTVRWPSSAPFKVSSPTSTTRYWYNLKAGQLQRYFGWEDREPYHPHAYDEDSEEQYPETELYATNIVRASDAYQWAFIGNPVEGFKIVNRLFGEDYSMNVEGTSTSVQGVQNVKNTVLREGDFRWTVHKNNNGFSLSLNGQNNFYINTHGGPHGYLQVWETDAARTDLGSLIIAEAVPNASLPMTPIGESYYTTLCLPYDAIVSNAKAYILEKGENDDEEDILLPIIDKKVDGSKTLAPALKVGETGFLLLTLVNDTIPAGTPVVLRSESETVTFAFDKGFSARPSSATALTGLFRPLTLGSDWSPLTLQGIEDVPGFYAFAGSELTPNQAYLKLKDASIQSIPVKFSDIEDGINEIKNEKLKIKNGEAVYDLSGRQIINRQSSNCELPRGVYIHNGRKLVKAK